MARSQLIVTPTGTLSGFVAIEQPSTKFDDDGVYSCQVDFTGSDATGMKVAIDKLMKESLDAGEPRGVKRAANPPYTVADKVLTVKFKQKAKVKTRDGRVYEMAIKLYDATGREIEEELGLGTGSKVKVAYTSYGWAVAALGCGVTLQPGSIQVIELVKYEGASSNPFEAVEGFTAAEKETTPFEDTVDDDGDF